MNPLPQTFISWDGTRIFYQKEVPYLPKAIIIISHGYSEHSDLYKETMACFVEEGYGVYVIDHRGNGRSEGEKGNIEKFEYFLKDFHALVQRIQDEYPQAPLYTLGHSMGGLISLLYAIQYPKHLQGQMFIGPAWGPPWGLHQISPQVYEKVLRTFSDAKLHRIFHGITCRDKEYIQLRKEDPYKLEYSTMGFFHEFLYRGITMAGTSFIEYTLPCLILHGTEDKVIPYEHSQYAFEQMTSQDKTLKLCLGCYHELLHEPEKGIIHQILLQWLEERI
ncbi:MAG: alpha/beta hydrolase [Epulopiscium sp.]|nr:alpha/beta hydrolase [Candidatus Epulonipiscium sp.]